MKKYYYLLMVAFLVMAAHAQSIDFPDVMFKARLLEASTTNTIAKDALDNNIAIDANADLEIDDNEAANVFSLDLSSAGISILDGINYFTNLTKLNINNNGLTGVDITGLSHLENFSATNNQLESVNFPIDNNLQGIALAQNHLGALDISNCTNLQILLLPYNQLANLNLTGINLTYLDVSHNVLSSITMSNMTHAYSLDMGYNQLTTVDLSSIQFDDLYGLATLDGNPLVSINAKNGTGLVPLRIVDNEGLQHLCVDDVEIAYYEQHLLESGIATCTVNAYCSFVPGGMHYEITGNQKWDTDSDGCGLLDPIVPRIRFGISNGVEVGTLICDASGFFHISVPEGSHTITPILENPEYFDVEPVSFVASFPTDTSPLNQNFCIMSNADHNDVEIIILPLTPAVPGFDVHYKLVFTNKGTTIMSGNILFNFNDALMDFISSDSEIAEYNPGQLIWHYVSLLPFEIRTINVFFNLNSPTESPAVTAGTNLGFFADITPIDNDEHYQNNHAELKQTVLNSFDPNDKTCLEGTTITPEMVGKYVHYIIRFENTGTANAQNIVVKDMIDTAKFDVNSLIPLDGSHEFVTRTSGNKVEFIFENINLPFDDANNDGYLAFKIKTKPTLVLGDTFSNTASIYFDYNFPIVTQPAVTAITALAKQDFAFDSYFRIYPNPAHDVLKIESKHDIEVQSISIYNTLGQLVLVVPTRGEAERSEANAKATKAVDVSGLPAGNYL